MNYLKELRKSLLKRSQQTSKILKELDQMPGTILEEPKKSIFIAIVDNMESDSELYKNCLA
jgi:hypothetical protein